MSMRRIAKQFLSCVIFALMFAMLLTGCSSDSEDKLINIEEPVRQQTYYIRQGTLNEYYKDHTTKEQAIDEFVDSINSLRTYLDGTSFVDTGYYMGVNYAIDLIDEENQTAGNFELRVNAYLYTYPYEDEDGNPIYKYYENGNYYDENNAEGTRTLVNALEIHNEAIKKSDISIEWYNGATNEVMIGLYFDGLNSNSDDPGNILYVDIQGARRSFPEFGDTVLYQQMIRLLVSLSVEGLLTSLGLGSDAGTNDIRTYLNIIVNEHKRTVNDDIIGIFFPAMNLTSVSDKVTPLLYKLFGPFGRKWDPLTYKYLGFRFSAVANATISTILADMDSRISPDKENVENVLTNAIFDFTGVTRSQNNTPYTYTCHVTFDYGWVYPESGLEVDNKDWYKEFDYGNYEFKGKLYVPAWDSQFDALIRTDMNPVDNTTNNVFIEFRDIANGELAFGIYYKNERSYLDITGLEYLYGWIDLAYLGFPQVYDEHLDLAYALKRFNILINNVIVSIVDSILDPATSDKKNKALEYIMAKTSITEKIEFTTEDEAAYREQLMNSQAVEEIRQSMSGQYDENYIREYIEEYIYNAVLLKKQESLFSANTETLLVDIELIKQMLEETGAGTFTTRQLINIIDSVLPYTLDQLAIMLGIPSAELMVEKTYFTLTLDVDTNLMTMIMYTNLGIEPGEPSNMMWKLELTPTHFGEAVPIAEIDFSRFKPLGEIYTYSGTLDGNFVFSSQETVDLSKLLSATIGESSGLNTPYVLDNNTGLSFELIYDQFVTDNYVNDDGIKVPEGDPTGVWKREGRSAFDLTLRIMGTDTVIIRLSSDDVSFNNEMYKKLSSADEKEKSEAEHAMGYIWVSIECVYKNGQQAIPKMKIREDVFMASMSAYMNGETSISDNVSSFADNDFNLSLTSIISALCKDAYVVPEPEQMEITSSNDTLQSLFRVKGLIGNIKVNAGFTYRVKGLQGIKDKYYMYQVGSFKDITGVNPYTTSLHDTLRTHFYQDFRDEYEPLDYDFYVYPEDVHVDDGSVYGKLIKEGTIMVFELGAKKSITRQPIEVAANSFYEVEGPENQDISLVKFSLQTLSGLVTQEQNKYYYNTYYNVRREVAGEYVEQGADNTVYIYWQGLREVVFYDSGESYYYFDMEKALKYEEDGEDHVAGDYVYIYTAEYRKLLFEYDPDSVEVTAYCKTQYSPRTNGSFMGVTRRYYLTLTSRVSAELGALHSVYYDTNTSWPPQYYTTEDEYNVVSVYDDDGRLIDMYYDPIALFVMEPAEPLINSYQFNVCTDPTRTTGIETWTPENETPHVRSKWYQSEWTTFPCRFVIDWEKVTLRGYFVVTEIIVAEGMMGQTTFPCRIIVTNREIDTTEYAVVYDKDNYVYRQADSSVAVPGQIVPANTFYVLSGDKYVLTTDAKFMEGTVYYEMQYYEANVPVVDEIDIDPYEYLLAKYDYLSDTNNFNPAGYATKERFYEEYHKAEDRFISDYFAQYVFDIVFAWERSVLYQLAVQNDYIARKYSNASTDEDGKTTITRFEWAFDTYKYGDNQEKLVKPAGGTVYIHTRFHGQLIALRLNVGVRKFSHVKFNVYDTEGNLLHEDTFDPDDYEGKNIQGKYTANYYDSSSYVIGTKPTFVFLDDKGLEHEIRFDMSYVSGLSGGNNYLVNPSYELSWSNPVITNVGAEGSYFLEYVYSALYAADSPTEDTLTLTSVKTDYEELIGSLNGSVPRKFVGGRYYDLYKDIDGDGYADVLATARYGTEWIPLVTYTGEPIAYSSLTQEMKDQKELVVGEVEKQYLYSDQGGYAYVRTSEEYEEYYTTFYKFGTMPMSSDNYSLLLTDMSVYYSDTGSDLALTEKQKQQEVTVDGFNKKLYADTDRDGFAEILEAVIYHDTLFVPVTTYQGELVPYKSLSDDQKRRMVATVSGSGDLYINVDGHAEIRKAVEYGVKYVKYTMPAFRNYADIVSSFVSYNDLTEAEKAQEVDVNGSTVALYRDANGYAETLAVEYKNEREAFMIDGERVYYDRLNAGMKAQKVTVTGETEEKELYARDPEGYARVLKIDHYLPRYETLVRYTFSKNSSIDLEEEIMVYTDMYEGDLFRFNQQTGKVEIRKATVYRADGSDDYYLPLVLNGAIVLRNTTYFTTDELSKTVTVSGEKDEQPYIVEIAGGRAAIRLGYWYTENEWEEFSMRGATFDSLDRLSAQMRDQRVVVRKKDYTVDLFRVNNGLSDTVLLEIGGATVNYDDLSEGEKGNDLFAADRDGALSIAAGSYFTDEWTTFTVGGAQQSYTSLSDALKNKTVKTISSVPGSGAYDFKLGLTYYAFSGQGYLFREGDGGVAEVRRPQILTEIRRVKEAGTERIDLILAASTVQYSALTAKEKRSGIFGESITHNAQLRLGGFYTEEWDVFTVGGTAFAHMGTFSADMISSRAYIRPEETEGKLYKSNPQGYVMMRDRAVVSLTEYLKEEKLWVEYGVGNAPLFKKDATGALSVRSDKKKAINRPFYVYYADYTNSKKAVYIGNEYIYEYEIYSDASGFVTYDLLSDEQKNDYIVNQAGTAFPTYLPFDRLKEETTASGERIYYYDEEAVHNTPSAYAYKRVDISLNSENSYETSIATVNFYSLFRLYSSIQYNVVALSVVDGEIIENEYPGAASKTEFPSVTVSVLVECPKQDPLVLSEEIVDQLDNFGVFYASDVSVGSEDLLYYQRGYYSVDPLLDSTAVLPSSITVYFEGGLGHTFTNLEWYAYYDESTGIGYSANRSGTTIVEKQPDGTYLVVIPFDETTTTKIMTRIGNATSGYKYITVALRMLSKNPIGIDFYRDNTKKTEYNVEQHDVNTSFGNKNGSTEAYYTYYANTFTGIVLPGYIEARFTSHTNRYDDVNWVTTTGEPIVYKPGTTIHLVSDIREWQTLTYSALSKMTQDEIRTAFDGWLIGTVYSGSFSSERMLGVNFLSQCIFSTVGLVFNFGDCDRLTLYRKVDLAVYLDIVVDNYELERFEMPSESTRSDSIYERYVLVDEEGVRKYVKVSDLIQWNRGEPNKVGLYYVNGGRKGYVVISNGSSLDNGVEIAKIGLFMRSMSGGEYVYRSAGVKTVQEFISEVYNKADITLKEAEFDYSLPYSRVEMYLYDEDNPDDKSSLAYVNISSLTPKFVSYDKQKNKVTFNLDRLIGMYCINVENGMVKVVDTSGAITNQIAFTDLISMVVANSLKTDIGDYRVEYVTKADGSENRTFDNVLSAFVPDRDFGTNYLSITLRDENDNLVTYTREELDYRLNYLRNNVYVSDTTIRITDKSAAIRNLSSILNVNDMIAYTDNGLARQMETEKFGLGKYLLSLGTGAGSFDMDAVIVFRGGFYYDANNAVGGVGQETILIQPYDLSGGAVYASGYNLGDNVQMTLSGVKTPSGGIYNLGTDEKFEYGIGSREKLSYWYVIESDIVGVTAGSVISYIPAESIYRTGPESGGAATMAAVTKEGFYITRRFEIEVLPDYIDSQTSDEFSSASGNASDLFVIRDGMITVDNIYEYDNDKGLDEYFATANYLPKSIVVTINGRRITINNVAWSILTNEWINNSYDTMDYRGTRNESKLFAEAYILGYRSGALAAVQGQIRLVVRIKIASAEIETLPWSEDKIALDTDVYLEGSNKRYVVYVDPYNSLGSSAVGTNKTFVLPTEFPAYTVGGQEPFLFSNVTYLYGADTFVTRIFYNLKGIDIERMTASGAEMNGTRISSTRSLNLYAVIGKGKTRQPLSVTFYFYNKEAYLTEAVLTVSDANARKKIAEVLGDDTMAKENELLDEVNIKRIKYNLELIMDQAQKLQSDIVNTKIPLAGTLLGASGASVIASMLYGAIPTVPNSFVSSMNTLPKTRAWSRTQCYNFALYYLRKEAEAMSADYGKLISNEISKSLSNTAKLNNIDKMRTQYVKAYAEAAYNNMIREYMESEFSTLFSKYMSSEVDRDKLNYSIGYKNDVEGAFDTEGLLNDVRKLRRLLEKGDSGTALALYEKQFDLTYAKAYGWFNANSFTINDLYRALMIERIYQAVFATDEKYGLRSDNTFNKAGNADLIAIRQTVLETLFARMGIKSAYDSYSPYVSYLEVNIVPESTPYEELNELKVRRNSPVPKDSNGNALYYELVSGAYERTHDLTFSNEKTYYFNVVTAGYELPSSAEVYVSDNNGFLIRATGLVKDGVKYYVRTSSVECSPLIASGVYAASSFKMTADVTLDGYILTAKSGCDSREMRAAINAVVERWFDFTERDTVLLTDFLNLPSYIINYSYTSISRYDASVFTIRRSLINGTDCTTTLTTLVNKAVDNFMQSVYVEQMCVSAIRRARSLNLDRDAVFMLPTESKYKNFTAYYTVEKATMEDFISGTVYEQDENSYYYETRDTDYDRTKNYYRFVKMDSDERYLTVNVQAGASNLTALNVLAGSDIPENSYYEYNKTNGRYELTSDTIFAPEKNYYYYGDSIALNGSLLTESVYGVSTELVFSGSKYYRFIEVKLISDSQEEVAAAGSALSVGKKYYKYHNGSNYYYRTTDTNFNASDAYYLFVETTEYGLSETYYEYNAVDDQYIPNSSGIMIPGTKYYLRKNVYVVSRPETVAARVGSSLASIGYYPRIYDEETGTYKDASSVTYEYYERRADGKYYLTKDTNFTAGHSYYAKLLLQPGSNRDYVAGELIATWEKLRGYEYCKEIEQSAAYVYATLYKTDSYFLYNVLPTVYNVTFDEATGGPSYRSAIAWAGDTVSGNAGYLGGNSDLYATLRGGMTGDVQTLNQKLEMTGHVLDEEDLVVRDPIGELGLAFYLHSKNASAYPEPDTTGYVLELGEGETVIVTRRSDGNVFRLRMETNNVTGQYYLSTMDGYDSEGYLSYRFSNTVDPDTGKLTNQAVSVFNPFEFKQSDLPSVVKFGDAYLDILWQSVSILPTGNLSAESPTVTGHIVSEKGQEIKLSLYVASWNYAGLYQPTTRATDVTYVVDGSERYFVYLNPIACYFSNYGTNSSVDCYLADFSIRILQEDGTVAGVSLTKTEGGNYGTVSYSDPNAGDTQFIKKLFYPYSGSSSSNSTSRLLEYGTDDSTMQAVQDRKKYLLYWDETTLGSLLSDNRHATRTGFMSFGNEEVGSFTLSRLRAADDTTTPVEVTYSYESMNISTLQVMPNNISVGKDIDADGHSVYTFTMAYYDANFVVTDMASGTCSNGHDLSVTRDGAVYVIRCTEPTCALYEHILAYNPVEQTCRCAGTGCQCDLFEEIKGELAGKSGQINLIMDVDSYYPNTGLVTLLENNVKYDPSELKVRLLWNQNYDAVVSNLKSFVSQMYPDVDASARELFAINLLVNWPNMSKNEQKDVIALAKEYYRNINSYLKDAYTDQDATNDAYNLLAIFERYDFTQNPVRLGGGGDTDVIVTVLIMVDGSTSVYTQSLSVKVIFSDYNPLGYYQYDSLYASYTEYLASIDNNTHYETVTVTNSMNKKPIPQNTYFEYKQGGYVLTGDNVFMMGKTYYRLKTNSVFIAVPATYWDGTEDVYTAHGKNAPYDNIGDSMYKLLQFVHTAKIKKGEFAPVSIAGINCRMVAVDNVYWTYNQQTGLMMSSEFTITVDGNVYKFTSTLLAMTLRR